MNDNLILIADDDSDIRDMLAFTLEAYGYQAVGAKDGHTAARVLTVAKPVGLITDVRMPAMNGIELCRLARRTPKNRDTAILMISGNADADDVDAGLDAGADRYLTKPLSARTLVTELRELISLRRPNAQ
jgi:two-component system OmpR family response regulator